MDSRSYMASADHSFKSNNLQQAINYANMAKTLNPQSQTIINSIAAYKIHLAAKKQGGEIDWYHVLDIKETEADLESIKKSFRKLAVMVHPDRNKSAAAESAFKLIGEAWEILSNPSSRKHYDLKRETTAAANSEQSVTKSVFEFKYNLDFEFEISGVAIKIKATNNSAGV